MCRLFGEVCTSAGLRCAEEEEEKKKIKEFHFYPLSHSASVLTVTKPSSHYFRKVTTDDLFPVLTRQGVKKRRRIFTCPSVFFNVNRFKACSVLCEDIESVMQMFLMQELHSFNVDNMQPTNRTNMSTLRT